MTTALIAHINGHRLRTLQWWGWPDAIRCARRLARKHRIRYRVVKIGPFWYVGEAAKPGTDDGNGVTYI